MLYISKIESPYGTTWEHNIFLIDRYTENEFYLGTKYILS